MAESRPKVLLACNQRVRETYVSPSDVERLEAFADWDWFPCEGGETFGANEDPSLIAALLARVAQINGIVVCHGSPRISAEVMDRAANFQIVGELEGDRFAHRIDVEAAWERSIRTVDTTNGSSYPVAEWALALILVSLRNAGAHFRRIIAGGYRDRSNEDSRFAARELTGRRVGLIGCGHMGRRLIKLLRPFDVDIRVYDPYLPAEMADALGFLQTSLEHVLSQSDVIVCVAPLTPKTRGMIGRRELDLIPSGAALVNVSRGAIIDSVALIARLKRGDITAGLDVFDPEPIPPDSEIVQLPNVFLSPHNAASATASSSTAFFRLMVDELDRFFHGHETLFDLTPRSVANRRGSAPR